jgi:hypothetical protein
MGIDDYCPVKSIGVFRKEFSEPGFFTPNKGLR